MGNQDELCRLPQAVEKAIQVEGQHPSIPRVHPSVETDYTILSHEISWEHTHTQQPLL
jgi:hypothetical protein